MPAIARLQAFALTASLLAIPAFAQTPGRTVTPDTHHDLSGKLNANAPIPGASEPPDCADPDHHCGNAPDLDDDDDDEEEAQAAVPGPTTEANMHAIPRGSAAVEQSHPGQHPPAALVVSFAGLGASLPGTDNTPQPARQPGAPAGAPPAPAANRAGRNPSDNSLAVGPDRVVQIVNSRMAVFDKQGKLVFGPVITNSIFAGFGGQCQDRVSGDAVVRYDQLAQRWLFVLPVFRRPPDDPNGPYSMCYAVSQGSDPTGPYYRYEFKRPLFPDYPRPAIWPDGYYIPSSSGDAVIQKQDCIADRAKMLKGEPATEQCLLLNGSGFLNNADIDGQALPAPGTPNIVIALGGAQLHSQFEDDGLYVYKLHVDWSDPSKTAINGPTKIPVAPYHYLCNGQLTKCVPQPGTETRLDAQGDKIMQRLVYRRIGNRESIVGLHSVNTAAGLGGVRWYELRLDHSHDPHLFQQGTYAPDAHYRWMPSIDMDRDGNIGMGYSWGGPSDFTGQRFAARLAKDPKGQLGLQETILSEGKAAQTNTLRWEDYVTTALDPSDDCTFWYVGDHVRAAGENYSTTIGAFRLPTCTTK